MDTPYDKLNVVYDYGTDPGHYDIVSERCGYLRYYLNKSEYEPKFAGDTKTSLMPELTLASKRVNTEATLLPTC